MSKLAIKGGSPLRSEAFPAWPQYDDRELQSLEKVLKSGVWGTLGNEVKNFSKRFAAYQHSEYGVAVTNGTVTLEVALRALGVGMEDEVIVPPYTFNATVSAVLIVGAKPVFVDIENHSYNIDPSKIEEAITAKTRAVIPVHIGGRPCDMDRIMEIAQKHGLYVVEDAAHAHGSEWKGRRVGSIGHAGSFSFQASKNLNAGEGGILTVNDPDIYEKCWSIHHCGRDLHGTVWYDHPHIGTNARMTEWQAVILNTQMDRLDGQIDKRMRNAEYLTSRLKEVDFIETMRPDERITRNSYHLFLFKYMSERCKGLPRGKFLAALSAEGIPCSPGYACLYKQGMLKSEEAKRILGSNTAYEGLYLDHVEKAANGEGLWITQNLLLGDKKDMDDIADAIIKIGGNVNELL